MNIGAAYNNKSDHSKALKYYQRALKLFEEIRYKEGIAACNINIGNIYGSQLNHSKAIEYNINALKIFEEIGDKRGIGNCYINIGEGYSNLSKYNLAIQYGDSSLKINKEIADINQQRVSYELLADAYAKTAHYKEAYNNYVQFKQLTDSIFNADKSKQLGDLKTRFEVEKKEAELKAKADAQQAIDAEKSKKQRIIIYSVAALLLLALVFGVFMFNRFRITQKQKHIIVEKQREILDSIHYAKRIQDALLKEQEHISVHLPEHFILFKPKDIVSGDFYWALEKENNWYVAAADCTGHGVPGAFLTMLGTSFLNEINATEELLTPAEILNRLRARIIKELSQTGKDGGSKDGMDISLVRLNLQTKEMRWAGANNSLYLIRNNELNETKADKQPIGYADNLKPFTDHLFQLQKGDSAIIFSDGYSDQFGGPKRRKFMSKQLKETLISISSLEMKEQKEKLNKTFEDWKGEGEQIDDVTVIGIRL